MRFQYLTSAALIAALAGVPGADAQPARSAPLRPVLLVSIDGLKPEYLQRADSLGLRLPTLRRLMREGASARGVRGVLPTLTYPSHTTLVTGRSPAVHGVYANTTFDPLLRNQAGWYWYADDIRVPALWDAVIQAGGTAGAVHWPVSVGANITWNVPQIWRTGMPDDRKLLRALATPGVLDTLEQRVGAPYPDGIDESITADERRARFVAQLLEWKRPTLTLAYLTAFDHEQHEAGPWTPKAFAVLERVDAALDTIVTAATRTFGDQVTVAIVSDHGFAASHSDIHLASAFVDRGFMTLGPDDRPTAYRATIWPSGGTAAVVLADSSPALVDSVRVLLDLLAADTTTGIARILDRKALRAQGAYPAAEFLVAFKPGYRLGYRTRGTIRTPATGGMHGYTPEEPQMRASFLIQGTGITPGTDLGIIDMRDIAPSLTVRLGVTLSGTEGQPRLPPEPPARFLHAPPPTSAQWLKGNTHTHTTNSDGDTPPEQVAQWYKRHRYDWLVLSDHNVFTDPQTLASLMDSTFLLIPGEEVTTAFKSAQVHVNALDITRVIAAPKDTSLLTTVQATIDAIRAERAIPHINHPNFRWSIDTTVLWRMRNDRLMEIHNGHPLVHNAGGEETAGLEEAWDALLTRGKKIYGIAVDDAHHFQGEFATDRANPGRGWVAVRSPRRSGRAIVEALDAGQFYASSGPVLDDVIVSDTSLTVRIRRDGDFKYTTQFVGENGRVLAVDRTLTPRYALTGSETYVRARVIDSGGRVAWVQPVFTTRFVERAR